MNNPSNGSARQEQQLVMDKDEFTLDTILVRIGQFGSYQLLIFLMICIPMLFNAIFSVTYVFTASNVAHRCNLTECDSLTSEYKELWTDWAIPRKGHDMDQCQRFENLRANNASEDENICISENFNRQKTVTCAKEELIFRNQEITISNEFGIFCADEWKLSLVGTLNNFGQFVGIPIGGLISDRYGRATSLALGGFISAIMGIIRSFAPNYIFFVVFEFLDNIACSTLYATCFIIGIELVGPKRRVIACSLITIFYAIGEVVLALVAKYYQNWRILLRIIYIPALVHFVYFWLLPESVRWLLSQGQEERAKAQLKRAAVVNRRRISDHTLDKMILANRNKLQTASESKFPIRRAFSSFYGRIANCAFCWIVNVLVYYGLSLNAVLLDGDKHNNFIFVALVEIPGFLLPYVTMDRLGRRYSLFGYMVISGICCLGTIFLDADQFYWRLSLFLIGKMTITASFQVLYFFTSEIFPTNVRNSLLSFCSMVGRIGSMLAPQTPLLAKYYENAPALLFASTAILSGFLSLFFPETTNLVLPATMSEADNIGTKSAKSKIQSNDTISTQL